MTEEEKKRTILELERASCKFPSKPEDFNLLVSEEKKDDLCEICDSKLEDNECYAHSQYARMHRRALKNVRNMYK